MGKVRILIRIETCILHVWTSADPHIRILSPAVTVTSWLAAEATLSYIQGSRYHAALLPA